MSHKKEGSRKGLIYASIIGLVLLANVVLTGAIVIANYPTEAHRAVARQMDILTLDTFNGTDFSKAMNTPEYKVAEASNEAKYMTAASLVTLLVNILGGIAIIAAVYYYLRTRRLTTKVVGVTVLLVSIGQLVPFIISPFATAQYVGTLMPGVGTLAFMLVFGVVVMPFVVFVVAKLVDMYYNRKHSFEI